MGYQVTITRNERGITEKEWQRLVDSDSELKPSEEIPLATIWLKLKNEPVFFLEYTGVWAWSPNDATIRKMIEIAEKLNAKVVGEDETIFELDEDGEIVEIQE